MDRDPKNGRFLRGNKLSVGNRGNRNPKWGNKNAKKHGFFSTMPLATIRGDGFLYIYTSKKKVVRIAPDGFIAEENGIRIRDDVAEALRGYGITCEERLE